MAIGLLTLQLKIPLCRSLKEKRSQIKPLLNRVGQEFNISVAELDLHDLWGETLIGCTYPSNDQAQTTRTLQNIIRWVEGNYPQFYIIQEQIEII